jgi:ribosomal protein RSM22 (predicted rRNA methylase)
VLRHPTISKGMVSLTVCAADGEVHRTIVSKSQGPAYRAARKTNWGDAWPPPAALPAAARHSGPRDPLTPSGAEGGEPTRRIAH